MFSVLIALKVWTHNGLFYIYMYDPCSLYMNNVRWPGEAGGATNNYGGNTFS